MITQAARPPKVVVFGSLNMDLVLRVPRAPGAGETLTAHAFATHAGGKGANQAVACARQGAEVVMAGRVGDDVFGAALREAVAADGIDARRVLATPGQPTGVALVMVDDAAENRIVVVPGANAKVDAADAAALREELRTARLLMMQCEVPMEAVQRAAEAARDAGCRVVLNPAPARPLPDALWSCVDLLLVNESEAALLCGAAVDGIEAAGRAAYTLHARGPAQVIVTMGERGLVLADARGVHHHPAVPVHAIDTTAAGDTFAGALCAALAQGESMDAALQRGIRAAAICVTRPGAQASIPRRDEIMS